MLAVIAVALAITAWPFRGVAATGIDPSWEAALQIAGPRGLQFGRDLIFTYGPLGFVSIPNPIYGPGSAVAFIAVTAAYACLAWITLQCAVRVVPLWAALIAAFLVSRFAVALPPFETYEVLVFVACVELLARPTGRRWALPIAAAGLVAGLSLLGKINVGVYVAAMLLVTAGAVSRPRWAGLALFAGAAAAALVVGWLVTVQSLADLSAYAGWSIEIIRGYGEAMVIDVLPAARWSYIAFAATAFILAWLGWRASSCWPRSRRLGLLVVLAILVFAEWKTAFTRAGVGHAMVTFMIASLPLAGRASPGERSTGQTPTTRPTQPRPLTAQAASLAFAAVGMAALATSRLGPIQLVDVYNPARVWLSSAIAFTAPGRLDQAVSATHTQLRAALGIDPYLIDAIGTRTVEIEPWQSLVPAAYPDLRWKPLPIFQTYAVWTTPADDANAAALRSADGPERILRERYDAGGPTPIAVDHRFTWWESPEAMLESICRYDELAASDRWQVLGRTNRACGPAEPLGSVEALAGEPVPVPQESRSDRIVIVTIHGLEPTLLDRLVSAIHRASEWYVTLGPDRGRFRLVPGTAADGLLVSVPSSITYSPRFAFGSPVTSIAVSAGRDGRASRANLTYEFLSLPVSRTAGG